MTLTFSYPLLQKEGMTSAPCLQKESLSSPTAVPEIYSLLLDRMSPSQPQEGADIGNMGP